MCLNDRLDGVGATVAASISPTPLVTYGSEPLWLPFLFETKGWSLFIYCGVLYPESGGSCPVLVTVLCLFDIVRPKVARERSD